MILFDVNETLLDMSALDPVFERIFGEQTARREWFKQLLQLSLVTNVVDAYVDFSVVGRAALAMIAEQRGRALSDAEFGEVAQAMRSLPAHGDVVPALRRLRDVGFALATLTNSPSDLLEAQLGNAGIREYFKAALSVDRVRAFKPAAVTYEMAARVQGVAISEVRLVAAHAWDVWGAMRAGAAAAFVARKGQVLTPLAPRPDIVCASLEEAASEIIERDR